MNSFELNKVMGAVLGACLVLLALNITSGAIFAPQDGGSPRRGAGADFSLYRARAHGCGVLAVGRFTVGPCAAIGVDAIGADGSGSDRPMEASSTTLTIGADVVARAQVSSFLAIRAVAGLAHPLGRPTFSVAGAGPIHRASAITIPVALAAEIDF